MDLLVPHHHFPVAMGGMDPASEAFFSPGMSAEQVSPAMSDVILPGSHLSSSSIAFGNAQEMQEGCKGVSCLQPLDSQLPLEAGSAAEVALQGIFASCCPSQPGSPEDAAVAAEGWLGGDRRMEGCPGALGGVGLLSLSAWGRGGLAWLAAGISCAVLSLSLEIA